MPELPEVETIVQGLTPHLEGAVIQALIIRQNHLRFPIVPHLASELVQQPIHTLERRAKYLIMHVAKGALIIHLGMSGSLRITRRTVLPKAHDHVDIVFSKTHLLRYTDPRRFGAFIWTTDVPYQHPLLQLLGPEPLSSRFTASYLYQAASHRRVAIKSLLMNSRIVAGIGNIYAAEALFLAQIHPATPAQLLTETDCARLVHAIQCVLQSAIQQGGTTIKDFINCEGKPGYFTQALQVYGRAGLPCKKCSAPLHSIKLAQRSTVFCLYCQLEKK